MMVEQWETFHKSVPVNLCKAYPLVKVPTDVCWLDSLSVPCDLLLLDCPF